MRVEIHKASSDPSGLGGEDLIDSTVSAARYSRIDSKEIVGVVPEARVVHVCDEELRVSEPLERAADQARECVELGVAQAGQRLDQVVSTDAHHHDRPAGHRPDRDLPCQIGGRRAVDRGLDDRDEFAASRGPEIATAKLRKEPVVIADKELLRRYAVLVVVPAIEDRVSEREEDGQRCTATRSSLRAPM